MTRKILSVVLAAVLIIGCTASICAADEPRMRAALEHLKEAREQLEKATPNKGGHREKAIEHVNHAIEQVERGIKFSEERHERY
jgi:DNA integrity scanning protein DisA with diadenylate cyclase activity